MAASNSNLPNHNAALIDKITEDLVKEAIKKILADKKSHPTSLNYAVHYSQQAMFQKGAALQVQCLYILNNITHWRHPDAKEVRRVLKDYTNTK